MSRGNDSRGGAVKRPFSLARTASLAVLWLGCVGGAAAGQAAPPLASRSAPPLPAQSALVPPVLPGTLRIAAWNVSFFRRAEGDLARELARGEAAQPRTVAAVLQRVRPDLLLINEFDYDPTAPGLFLKNFLGVSQQGAEPLHYPHHFIAPSNTGVASGLDFDRDGKIGGGNDALGFGQFPGQYGMVVFSRLPINRSASRTFRNFLWRDLPDALLPPGWYDANALAKLPLSSKSHWDVVIEWSAPPAPGRVAAAPRRLHFLVSHPTPPSFDGPEDRNGRRNHDEIRLWADYIEPARSRYLVDDRGRRGGLAPGASFVIAGDLNADPVDGGSVPGAIAQLLEHPRVHREAASGKRVPRSPGSAEASLRQGAANGSHRGDAAADTGDFSDGGNSVGNLRVDYVLPSADLEVCRSGIYWPQSRDAEFALVNDDVSASSDHRLVWVDIAIPGGRCPD